MIDISKGRYWDEGITLVDGCTPCSPGCDHCWSAAQAQRFLRSPKNGKDYQNIPFFTGAAGRFNSVIQTHPDRLKRFNTRTPKVFAIWNDLFHETVPDEFICQVFEKICSGSGQNKYLILTKRPGRMASWFSKAAISYPGWFNPYTDQLDLWDTYLGLTVCNQEEADEKIPIFLQVPGKKFLSIEPMLSEIKLPLIPDGCNRGFNCPEFCTIIGPCFAREDNYFDAVILGGETGPGARPMHPDWVRSIRKQCDAAGVPFFFKQWGKYWHTLPGKNPDPVKSRLLDGRTHDELPWREG